MVTMNYLKSHIGEKHTDENGNWVTSVTTESIRFFKEI